MNKPEFTVVLPTRNRLEKMRRALTSVEQQTLQSFEVIIVDDGSTDGTAQYLAQGGHIEEFPGIPETVVIHNDRGEGAGHARNQALKRASGELIAFLDDDDVWMPDYLKAQAMRLQENPTAGASCAAHIEIDSQKRTHHPDLERLFEYDSQLIFLLTESFVHSMSVLVARRSAFEELGLLNQELHVCHDWEWCARLLSAGYSILPPGSEALVKREIPGGLVLRIRDWYEEEQTILKSIFQHDSKARTHRKHIQAYRNLLFARISVSRKDFGFAFRRLCSALLNAPIYTIKLARLKLTRNRRTRSFNHQ